MSWISISNDPCENYLFIEMGRNRVEKRECEVKYIFKIEMKVWRPPTHHICKQKTNKQNENYFTNIWNVRLKIHHMKCVLSDWVRQKKCRILFTFKRNKLCIHFVDYSIFVIGNGLTCVYTSVFRVPRTKKRILYTLYIKKKLSQTIQWCFLLQSGQFNCSHAFFGLMHGQRVSSLHTVSDLSNFTWKKKKIGRNEYSWGKESTQLDYY